jgi:hypothetical protein
VSEAEAAAQRYDNATLAISGGTLLAGAGLPLTTTQQAVVVAYRLGAG